MVTKKIIEGLQILERYRNKPDGFNCGAEHDVLYVYPTDKPLSDVDLARMVELGWRQEHYGDGDFSVADYRLEESWQAFT